MTRPPNNAAKSEAEFQPITMRVAKFCEWADISERMVYRMIRSGELKSVKFGRMRLINVEDYRRMINHGNEHGKIP